MMTQNTVEFDVGACLGIYLDDPQKISTPNADPRLLEFEHNISAWANDTTSHVLVEIRDILDDNPMSILRATVLDTIQYLLKQSSYVQPALLAQVLDIVVIDMLRIAELVNAGVNRERTDYAHYQQGLEAYAFLLQWTLAVLETRCSERSSAASSKSKAAKGTKSKAPGDEYSAAEHVSRIQATLETLCKVMKIKLSVIFITTGERDAFVGMLARPVYLLLENEKRVKETAIRMHAFKVLCLAVKHHGHGYSAQTSIVQNLTYFEHLAEPMAEFLSILAEQYDYPQLTEDVLKELSAKEFSTSDTKGPKSVSTFIIRCSELAPRIVQKQVSFLAKMLESEHYTLRCALIEVCGNLIMTLSRAGDDERNENHRAQINAFFDVLEERFLDINPYCRCRSIQVFSKLCGLETKYPKRRQTASELVVRSLNDKSSHVRRYAIRLLGRLLATHPFGLLHGGLLSLQDWSQRLADCQAELDSLKPPVDQLDPLTHDVTRDNIEGSVSQDSTSIDCGSEQDVENKTTQAVARQSTEHIVTAESIGKLELTRRYYQEALRFIQIIHDAIPGILQLLSSRNKNEVVEAMDFFVIADAYHIEMAKHGIRRMLRLIWTKGNSDEGKGVQSHLIDCYRELFFNAPDSFSPNDAANYIARNMISLTYGATPAELTSLEQMLATMMKDDGISEGVVQKLWQIYGAQRPEVARQQRRGAIIVLGMLALANSQIIVRELETCLRIGLGSYGRSDLGLAKYTCIALMRMTEHKSAKRVQATALTRLSNDHIILATLVDLIGAPTEDPDWYSFAEQAISAVYILAKSPDILCSDTIRRKTRSIFVSVDSASAQGTIQGKTIDCDGDTEMSLNLDPGASDPRKRPTIEFSAAGHDPKAAVALSQLMFLVGHVALKQIVHLELCETDYKRRKAAISAQSSTKGPVINSLTEGNAVNSSLGQDREQDRDELDVMAGSNEDDFSEAMAHIRERELLYGPQALLRNFGMLAQEICSNRVRYSNPELQCHAALCMAKLMCVSSEYCESSLGLLITSLERSDSPIIRSNLVVALGDMAVCFNHLVDENTEYLYKRLADKSLMVRRTCLMTLTFLILAGQVKVKGQLGDMAKCVEDADERIREMSRMFFGELAGKDNAIYNNFVDIFSLLSNDPQLPEEKFRKIVKFLTSFVEKDKHAKQLAGKLATRMTRAETDRQWNDLAYTLGLLPHKSEEIAKLISEGCPIVMSTA